jgi:DNA-directed RNA polymerase specialized sigma24 family protein
MADGADLAYSTRVFGEHRDLLVGVAYRVLGSVTDAEDAVQEAWLRWSKVDPAEVANPRAFLVRVTTRLAIDRLRRAKARRESYVGPWLPEPVLTGHDVAEEVELAESRYAAEMLARKYPILHGVLIPRLHRLRGNRTMHIELTPVTS